MAEISVGDITARLSVDASQWQRGLSQAQQQLTQFAQQVQRGLPSLTPQVETAELQRRLQQIEQQYAQLAQTIQRSLGTIRPQVDTSALTASLQQIQQQVSQLGQQIERSLGTVRPQVDTTEVQRGLKQAQQAVQELGQTSQQTRQQLSQLPVNAIQNAIDQFSRSLQSAGNNQDRYRSAITQAQQALNQFGVTTTASGAMVDRFGQRLSQASAQQLRGFTAGIQEARAELGQLERFGINAGASLGRMGSQWSQIAQIAGGIGLATTLTGIARAMANTVTESVRLSAQMQDLHRTFTAIDGSAGAANATIGFLFQTAQRVGVEFATLAESFKRMDVAARGTALEGEGIRRVFEGVVSGARVLGVGSQELSRGLVALEQAMTKGKLSAEEYRRQLGNAIPGALGFMASGLGIATKAMDDMVQLGIIPVESALVALGNTMGQLRQSGLQASLETMTETFAKLKNETTAWLTALGNSITAVLQPFLQDLIKISEELRRIFKIGPPGTQPTAGASEGPGVLGTLFPGPITPETLGLPAPGTLPYGPSETARDEPAATLVAFASSQYDEAIKRIAAAYDIDPIVFSRQIQQESGFRSRPGPRRETAPGRFEAAQGLGQILPSTAADYGVSEAQLQDAETNLRLSARIFADYREKIRGRFGVLEDETRIVLAAYNAGIGRVMRALEETKGLGEALTYPQVLGRLPGKVPAETGPYVERIMGRYVPGAGQGPAPYGTAPSAAAVPAGGKPPQDPFAPMLKTATEVETALTAVQLAMDNVAKSTLNTAGQLSGVLTKQADDAIAKYTTLALQLAAFPQLWENMSDAQRAQVEALSQQVLLVQERLRLEVQTEGGARQRVNELRRNEAEAERIVEQARQQLPQLEADLARIQEFAGRPGRSAAEQARAAVEQQGIALLVTAQKALEAITQHPAVLNLAPQIRAQFEQAMVGFPEAVAQKAAEAAQKIEAQQRATISGISDQIDQMGLKIGAAGLTPLEADLARIRREFAQMADQLTAWQTSLLTLRREATPAGQQAIDAEVARLEALRPQLPGAEIAAVEERRTQALQQSQATIRGIEDQIDQMGLKIGAAGLSPLEADLARIQREFAAMTAKLLELQAVLTATRRTAPEEVRPAIDAALARIGQIQPQIAGGAEQALFERRTRDENDYIRSLEQRLEQLRTPSGRQGFPLTETREAKRFYAKGEEGLQTAAGRARTQQLREELLVQEQINYAVGIFEQLAGSVSQSWSGVLEAIFAPAEDQVDRFQLGQVRERLASARQEMRDLQVSQEQLPQRMTVAQQQYAANARQASEETVRALQEQEAALLKVEQGTNRVAEAFRAMGKALLQTMAQIAQQEAFRALIQLGSRLLTGALTGALTPTAAAGPSGLEPSSSFIGSTLGGGGTAGGGFSFASMLAPAGGGGGIAGFQHGGVVNKPTFAMLGEGPHNPEYVLNRIQMDHLMRAGPSAGGQAAGGNGDSGVTIMNFPSRAAAEESAAQQRALGKQVVLNEIMTDLSQGEGSQIARAMRLLQR